MQQPNAPDLSALSPVRPLKLSYSPIYARKSNAPLKMNRTIRSLANLARVSDRFQTSQYDRRTRLMSSNRFLRLPALQPLYSPS
eukprot:4807400-Pyramimonas_sp.AAC.1